MTAAPVVAVIIPVRNGADEIGACLEAIGRQVLVPAEVVVVDNGSTDGTAEVARRGGATVVAEPTPGSYHARNRGLAATTSPLIAFTDADCLPEPDWLERLVVPMADPSVGVVAGEIVPDEVTSVAQRWAVAREVLVQRKAVAHEYLPFAATANALMRRSALEAVGGFEPTLFSGGDVDCSWRIQVLTGLRVALAPDAVVRHRHRRRVRTLVRQERKYAEGHGRLDGRWAVDPAYVASRGRAWQRLRAAYLAPARVVYWSATRRDPRIPLIDLAVRTTHEVSRARPAPAAAARAAPVRIMENPKEERVSLYELTAVLRRRWKMVAFIAGGLMIVGTLIIRSSDETTYTATSSIIVDQPRLVPKLGGVNVAPKFATLGPTLCALMGTDETAAEIAEQLDTPGISASCSPVEGTTLLAIRATADGADEAEAVVDVSAEVLAEGIAVRYSGPEVEAQETVTAEVLGAARAVEDSDQTKRRAMLVVVGSLIAAAALAVAAEPHRRDAQLRSRVDPSEAAPAPA